MSARGGREIPAASVRPPLAGGFLLVAAPRAWRDACFAVPAVRAIRKARPNATLAVVFPEEQRALWESVGLQRLLPYPARHSARGIAAMLRECAERWDAAVVWEAGAVADACARLGIAERTGPAVKGLARRLTRAVDIDEGPGPTRHRVRGFLAVVEALGIDAYQADHFEAAGLAEARDRCSLVLVPDSDFGPSHEWALQKWVEAGRALSGGGGIRLVVAGLAGGRGLARALGGALGEVVEAVHEWRSPGESLAELARHGVCAGAEGTLMHMAAHAGVPCVTLYGPGDPAWLRPLGRRNSVVRRHVECAPCLLEKCPLDMRCQRELEVAAVVAAVSSKLAEARV